MANELVHASVGTSLTQAEFEGVGLHVLNSQATGDLIYASSATQLTRLGIGTSGAYLQVVGGVPIWGTRLLHTANTFALQEATTISSTGTITIYPLDTLSIRGALLPYADDNHELGNSSYRWNGFYVTGLHSAGYKVKFDLSADSSSAANMVDIGGYDIDATHRCLAIGSEETVATETVTSDATLRVRINGATVKLCIKL